MNEYKHSPEAHAALAAGEHKKALAIADKLGGEHAHNMRLHLTERGVLAHPQAQHGETVHELMKRAKRPGAGAPKAGDLKVITCQSALHDTRADMVDEHNHSNELGVYDGVVPPAMVCNRCAHHDRVAERKRKADERDALKKAFNVDDAALDLLILAAKG